MSNVKEQIKELRDSGVDDVDQEQIKFLTRSLMKQEKNPPELQHKINETELTAVVYKSNPAKYVREWSK